MDVVLYVLDSLRPDFLSTYGAEATPDPNIQRLAKQGTTYRFAFAQSSWTRSSGASLLSSTYPSTNGVFSTEDRYPSNLPTIATELREHGYVTVGITAMGNISSAFGFDHGFDEFVELYRDSSDTERGAVEAAEVGWQEHFDSETVRIATGADINAAVEDVLDRYPDDDVFFFIWSIDTHDPYFHRDPDMASFANLRSDDLIWSDEVRRTTSSDELAELRNLYRDMIRYADRYIGDLVELLRNRNRFEDSMFILTGDHGESFGECDVTGHGHPPYEEQVRVPLVVRYPGQSAATVDTSMVELTDIYPTIVDTVGGEVTSEHVRGMSLQSDSNNHLGVFSEIRYTDLSLHYYSLRTVDERVIIARPPELSAVESPKDLARLIKRHVEARRKWPVTTPVESIAGGEPIDSPIVALESLIESLNVGLSLNPSTTSSDMDNETESQLRSLGYID